MEDPDVLKAIVNDQIDRFWQTEDRDGAQQVAEFMVNVYHRDKPMYEAWKMVAESVKSPFSLKRENVEAIGKRLGSRVALKVYVCYLNSLDGPGAHPMSTFLLSQSELADLARNASVNEHDLRNLAELNERASQTNR